MQSIAQDIDIAFTSFCTERTIVTQGPLQARCNSDCSNVSKAEGMDPNCNS